MNNFTDSIAPNRSNTPAPSPGLTPRRPALGPTAGLALIGLGATLLLASQMLNTGNWWTIFILLTAVGLLAAGLPGLLARHPALQVLGRLTATSGALVLAVGAIFLFGVPWKIGWTLMVIVSGVLMILISLTTFPAGSLRHAWVSLLGWAGVTTALLGVTFLADRTGVISLTGMFGTVRWWSAFVLLPGVLALAHGLSLTLYKGRTAGAATLLLAGLLLCVEAAAEFLGLSEHWSPALLLILMGVALLLPSLWSAQTLGRPACDL